MTRDEFGRALMTTPFSNRELRLHDTEQRRVIEESRRTAEYWKAEHLAGNKKIEQQAQQIATLKSELSQRTNLEGSAPCWNSAHMRQIATLREALEWDGLKVSDENVQWALTELGPVGTRAESYVKAVVEFAIHMRRKAQQALKETVT